MSLLFHLFIVLAINNKIHIVWPWRPQQCCFYNKKIPPPPSTQYVLVGSNLQPLQWQASALPSTQWRMSCKTLQISFSGVSLQILEIIFEPFTANLNIFYGLSDWGQNQKGLKVYFLCFRISYYIWNQYLFSDTVLSMLRFTNRVIKPVLWQVLYICNTSWLILFWETTFTFRFWPLNYYNLSW